MNLLSYCYGMDSLERHRSMAAVIREVHPPPATLLDVGGESSLRCNHLGRFLPEYTITTINVGRKSDVRYDGGILPFDDGTFDILSSIDTAEHIPPEARRTWVADCLRATRRSFVICAPMGTDYQTSVDRELNDLFKELFGREHHYLSEHVACGMPTIDELKEWIGDRDHLLFFDGDARVYRRHMQSLFALQKKGGLLEKPFKILHQFSTLRDLEPLQLHSEPTEFTRRFYLVIKVD